LSKPGPSAAGGAEHRRDRAERGDVAGGECAGQPGGEGEREAGEDPGDRRLLGVVSEHGVGHVVADRLVDELR
jgi:hypothetical protein